MGWKEKVYLYKLKIHSMFSHHICLLEYFLECHEFSNAHIVPLNFAGLKHFIYFSQEDSSSRFLKDKNATHHFPSDGEGTLSGVIIDADEKTGLAKDVSRLILGGSLVK